MRFEFATQLRGFVKAALANVRVNSGPTEVGIALTFCDSRGEEQYTVQLTRDDATRLHDVIGMLRGYAAIEVNRG